mgnify:CR=1 FL=1
MVLWNLRLPHGPNAPSCPPVCAFSYRERSRLLFPPLFPLGRVLDLGRLPGDFAYEGDGVRIYVPLATMIVLSLVLTLLLNLALRLFR